VTTSFFSTSLPRITERRPNETGRGGRASDAGVKVALFGATGFLGRYVSSGLGEFCCFVCCCCCMKKKLFGVGGDRGVYYLIVRYRRGEVDTSQSCTRGLGRERES